MAYDNVVIIDPGMLSVFGHHHSYNQLFQGLFTARGLQPFFLFNSALPPEIRDDFLPAATVLDCDFYHFPDLNYANRRTFEAEAAKFATALTNVFGRPVWKNVPGSPLEPVQSAGQFETPVPPLTKNTLLFAHSLDPLRMLGLALWYSKQPSGKRPFLAINAMLGIEKDGNSTRQFATLCGLIKNKPKVRLFGATRHIAAKLSELCGKPCAMLPTPLPENLPAAKELRCAATEAIHRITELARTTQNQSPTPVCDLPRPLFGILGDARPGKNLHLLPTACALYLQKGCGSIWVQLTPTAPGAVAVLEAFYDLQLKYPDRLRLDYHKRDTADFYAEMAGLDALLLPYDPAVYHTNRASGPGIEATALGVPLITPGGGFLEDELKGLDNGSLFIARAEASLLMYAMLYFDQEYQKRIREAEEAAVNYRKFHSPENIWNLLNFNIDLF